MFSKEKWKNTSWNQIFLSLAGWLKLFRSLEAASDLLLSQLIMSTNQKPWKKGILRQIWTRLYYINWEYFLFNSLLKQPFSGIDFGYLSTQFITSWNLLYAVIHFLPTDIFCILNDYVYYILCLLFGYIFVYLYRYIHT